MVSIGTIFSIGIVGALAIGGYALYRNSDKIGGALTRSVEGAVVNPLGKWADSVWSGIARNTETSTNNTSTLAGQTVDSVNNSTITIPVDTVIQDDGTVTSSTPPLLDLSQSEKEKAAAALAANREKTAAQNAAYAKSIAPKAGYYYFNVVGTKYDTQQHLTAEKAKQLFSLPSSKVFNPKGLTDITFMGVRALSQSQFTQFGKSKGYL